MDNTLDSNALCFGWGGGNEAIVNRTRNWYAKSTRTHICATYSRAYAQVFSYWICLMRVAYVLYLNVRVKYWYWSSSAHTHMWSVVRTLTRTWTKQQTEREKAHPRIHTAQHTQRLLIISANVNKCRRETRTWTWNNVVEEACVRAVRSDHLRRVIYLKRIAWFLMDVFWFAFKHLSLMRNAGRVQATSDV